jgi:hypothetical protein
MTSPPEGIRRLPASHSSACTRSGRFLGTLPYLACLREGTNRNENRRDQPPSGPRLAWLVRPAPRRSRRSHANCSTERRQSWLVARSPKSWLPAVTVPATVRRVSSARIGRPFSGGSRPAADTKAVRVLYGQARKPRIHALSLRACGSQSPVAAVRLCWLRQLRTRWWIPPLHERLDNPDGGEHTRHAL